MWYNERIATNALDEQKFQEDKTMAVVKELIRTEENGGISFGNYELPTKSKASDFPYQGDIYKVKTFNEITKLEKNGMFVYESVPGTAVENFKASADEVVFNVSADKDIQVTLELEADTEYVIYMDDVNIGTMKTNLSGKISVSAEMDPDRTVEIKVKKK